MRKFGFVFVGWVVGVFASQVLMLVVAIGGGKFPAEGTEMLVYFSFAISFAVWFGKIADRTRTSPPPPGFTTRLKAWEDSSRRAGMTGGFVLEEENQDLNVTEAPREAALSPKIPRPEPVSMASPSRAIEDKEGVQVDSVRGSSLLTDLERAVTLYESGVLTPAEFSSVKAQIIEEQGRGSVSSQGVAQAPRGFVPMDES